MNAIAIYVMVKGEPGIKRSRLYKASHGKEIFDRMASAGLVEDRGEAGCYLTPLGETIGASMASFVDLMGESSLVEAYVADMVDWYQDKIDRNRDRNYKRYNL